MRRALVVVLVLVLAPLASATDEEPQGLDAAGALAKASDLGASAAGSLADAAGATGAGVAAASSATASALGSALVALGSLLAAAGSALAGAGAAVGGALAALAGAVADALAGGAAWARAHPRDAAVAGGAVAGASALTGALVWLKRLGAFAAIPLYSRLSAEDVLGNASRAAVYSFIQANPGAHPSAIGQAVGIGWGTTVYHLGRLEERGLVSATKRGTMKCYFASGTTPVADRAEVVALKHPTAAAIADFVRAHPQARQKDVAEALGLSAALVSWHVGRLETAGVLSKARAGKGTTLAVAPEPLVA